MARSRAIAFVAMVEALKGTVVLLAASGALALVHRDLHAMAVSLVAHAHLNPASRYPRIFLDAAAHLQDTRLLWLATGAAGYGGLRLLEAYGLFRERPWAEWLAAGSGALYVPFELLEMVRAPSVLGALVLVLNLLVVALMVRALAARRHAA